MNFDQGELSPSGVQIAADFRDNLIIDRYDPVFADMRASKVKHLRSANSEDAVTWNVFRLLRQIAPQLWLPVLWQQAFPAIAWAPFAYRHIQCPLRQNSLRSSPCAWSNSLSNFSMFPVEANLRLCQHR